MPASHALVSAVAWAISISDVLGLMPRKNTGLRQPRCYTYCYFLAMPVLSYFSFSACIITACCHYHYYRHTHTHHFSSLDFDFAMLTAISLHILAPHGPVAAPPPAFRSSTPPIDRRSPVPIGVDAIAASRQQLPGAALPRPASSSRGILHRRRSARQLARAPAGADDNIMPRACCAAIGAAVAGARPPAIACGHAYFTTPL